MKKSTLGTISLGLAAATVLAIGSVEALSSQDKKRVEEVLSLTPSDASVKESYDYYNSRSDTKNFSENQKWALAQSRARLIVLANGLQDGSVPLKKFIYDVLGSRDRIVTNELTRLGITSSFSGNIQNADLFGEVLSVRAGLNTLEGVENPHIDSAIVDGGTLKVTLSGNGFENTSNNNQDVAVFAEGINTALGPVHHTIDCRLLTAAK